MMSGPDDYLRYHYADVLKDTIDDAFALESTGKPPVGHSTKSYSRELWDEYWNNRIYYIFDLEKGEHRAAYEGPSGAEFIRHMIEERRERGLPEIQLEERNRERVPYELIPNTVPENN
jgi:hypothetical protein